MGKGSSKLNLIYLVGMALVVIGFIMPMFQGLGMSSNGLDFINLDNFNSMTIAAILIFVGAVAGIVFCFISMGNSDMLKLIALIATIAGGVIIVLTYNKSGLSRLIGKGFWRHATIGTYMVLAGWVVGVVGWLKK